MRDSDYANDMIKAQALLSFSLFIIKEFKLCTCYIKNKPTLIQFTLVTPSSAFLKLGKSGFCTCHPQERLTL